MSARTAIYSFLVLGILSTLGFLVFAAQGFRGLLSGFTLWGIVPYFVFGAAICIARTRGSVITVSVVSLAAVFFAAFLYIDAFFIHTSSTSALAFIFIPLYQLLAAVVVLVFALERRRHASPDI